MADKIKKFWEKKKAELSFKRAGPGHKLGETATCVPSKKPDKEVKERVVREQTEAEKQAAAAALARFGGGGKSSKELNTSHASIQAQARKQLERERQMELAQMKMQAAAATSSASPKVDRKEPLVTELEAPPVLAVNGVYFRCPLIGEEVLCEEEWMIKIREFLDSSLMDDDRGLTACLMIRTLNQSKEKVDQCVETLQKYLANILHHPDEEKYRKIRMSNKVFQERVLPMEGALEFLLACGFNQVEIDGEQYLLYEGEGVTNLEVLSDALHECEPIHLDVDRNIRVFNASSLSLQSRMEFPPEFFRRTADELRKEQKEKTDQMKLELTLRTKAMRERDEKREVRQYKFCIVRVKFPDSYILQGTFSVREKYADILEFVRSNIHPHIDAFSLSMPGVKFGVQDEHLSLSELQLVPAALLNMHCDSMPLTSNANKKKLGDSLYLKPDVSVLVQD